MIPTNTYDETSGFGASDVEALATSKDCSHRKEIVENTRDHSNSSSSISTRPNKSSSSNALQNRDLFPPSPSITSSYISEDSTSTSLDSRELDGASSCKKPKMCQTPTYSGMREGSRSGLKSIIHNFTQQMIESQENLLSKTIEEQRKLDKEMLNEYNHIFTQQTQILLIGLQNLQSSPQPTNYNPTFQQFPSSSVNGTQPSTQIPSEMIQGFPEVSPMLPMNPMVTKHPLHQPYPMFQHTRTYQSDKNTAHSYSSPWHKTQARPKLNETKKIPEFTTLSHQPLVQNSSTSHNNTSTISRSETSRALIEDEDSSELEYEQIEYLDYTGND